MIPERVSMQVLPVDGTYSAAEEARRRAEQEMLNQLLIKKHFCGFFMF